MEWDKKKIGKPVEKSALDTRSPGIVTKFKPVALKSIRANMPDQVYYQTRKLAQVALLDAERRKAETLTLIRRAAFI